MSERLFAWAAVVSTGAHAVGFASASMLSVGWLAAPPPPPVPVEIVAATPPPPPVTPPPPAPPRPAAPLAQPVSPPRLVPPRLTPARSVPDLAPRPAETRTDELPRSPVVDQPLLAPPEDRRMATALLDSPANTSPAISATPSPRAAGHPTERDLLARATAGGVAIPGPSVGGAGGTGALLSAPAGSTRAGAGLLPEGDGGLPAGGLGGSRRGSGAPGSGGPGLSGVGSAVASAARGGPGSMVSTGEIGMLAMPAPAGVLEGAPTTFARPLGGYQLTPPYPEAARRQGIQGTALLRFEVLATGRVGRVVVDRSAGHPDLDRAAIDAVQQWRFEPARRGPEPVAVWVTLPVHFELR